MAKRSKALLAASLFFLSIYARAGSPAPDEVRGLWVVRTTLKSPEAIDVMVEEAAAAGFNTLLVQVRGRGDAFYKSKHVPRSESLGGQPDSFDPLAYTLVKARAKGLKVHAWVNTLLVGGYADRPSSPSHILRAQVNWLSVPQSLAGRRLDRISRPLDRVRAASRKYGSEVEGFFVDPGEPAAAEHLRTVVLELITRYELDGVHLDYLRYPHPAFGYSARALQEFQTEVERQIPARQRQRLRKKCAKDPLIYTRSFPTAWDNFRRRRVTECLRQIKQAVDDTSGETTVSVAVVADSETARKERLQDWKLWLEQGLLDAICPMAYSPKTESFRDQVAMARRLSFGRAVWAGIGAWQMKVPDVLEKIRVGRRIGTEGFVLFSYDGLITESPLNPSGRNLRQIGSFLKENQAEPAQVISSR